MKLFADKDTRNLFIAVITILISFVILGQIGADRLAEDYKRDLIKHDYGVAGYLYRNNQGLGDQLPYGFTAQKTPEDFTAGQEVLQASGYQDNVNKNLIYDVQVIHQRYSVLALIIALFFAFLIISALLLFIIRQNKRLEQANNELLEFMKGDKDMRLHDSEEGSLSLLFSTVNSMATSLSTHAAREKSNREFLKETISDISHQLKTPLAALKMYNEIIQGENLQNEVVDKFTAKSENELQRMENLIQKLLKLARLDSGTMELERKEHSLQAVLEQAAKGFYTRAEVENKTLALACSYAIRFYCDREWLVEAVSNIVKNALDHTASGDHIEILCDETPVITRIRIQDSGQGIHPEDIHHIFKRFYRSRFSKDNQGVGIGLTLSKAIIEKHGGSIMAESELGKGTVFSIVFPKLTNL